MKIDMVNMMEWKGYKTIGNRNLCVSVAISKLLRKLSKMLAKRYPESMKLRAISLKTSLMNAYTLLATLTYHYLHHIEAVDHLAVR